jgi:dienelactone hydrolase
VNANIDNLLANAKTRNFFLYAPQLSSSSSTWSTGPVDNSYRMLSNATRDYNVDLSRVYVTGLSLGGGGVWDGLLRFENALAGAVSICGVNPNVNSTPPYAGLAGKPIWSFHAMNDGTVNVSTSRNRVNAIRADDGGKPPLVFPLNASPSNPYYNTGAPYYTDGSTYYAENNQRYTEYSSGNHGIWGRVYNENPMYDWLLAQSNPISLSSLQPGEEMYFDFGNTAAPATDSQGRQWNSTVFGYHNTPGAVMAFSRTSAGRSTPVTLDVKQVFAGHFTNGLTGLYDTAIGTDGWATVASGPGELRLRGLIPGAVYRLELFASSGTANRMTRFQSGSAFADLNPTGNTSNVATLDLTADAKGWIEFTVAATPGSGSTVALINDLKLTLLFLPSTGFFTQNFSASTAVTDYVSPGPLVTNKFSDISAEVDGGAWSINANRLRLLRTTVSSANNGAGFTRVSGPVATAPAVMDFSFKVALNAVNTFNDLASLDLGTFTTVSDYNGSTPSVAVANRLTLKGAGNGVFFFQINGINSTQTWPANGTSVAVSWIVNQSGTTQTYKGPNGATQTVATNTADLWVNNVLIFNDAVRTSALTATKVGGFRFRTSISQAIDFIFDDFDLQETLPQ